MSDEKRVKIEKSLNKPSMISGEQKSLNKPSMVDVDSSVNKPSMVNKPPSK
ncbi:hypothetical protein [Paenibacillus sp. NRS-1780]|uniref:hypothetical protein n=1 Tax=Paenibacillus sp. NRS-1780 TaxID=3233904 RepID=UPI003D26FF7A